MQCISRWKISISIILQSSYVYTQQILSLIVTGNTETNKHNFHRVLQRQNEGFFSHRYKWNYSAVYNNAAQVTTDIGVTPVQINSVFVFFSSSSASLVPVANRKPIFKTHSARNTNEFFKPTHWSRFFLTTSRTSALRLSYALMANSANLEGEETPLSFEKQLNSQS